jgi:F-type H+-transporting ATPase subunit b
MPPILQLDLQQILSQAISFALLVVVLRKFAWGPLLGILDQRRARIEADLRQAAESKEALGRLQHELSTRLAKIDEETRNKIQQALLEAKRVSLEMQEQARVQARAILAKSQETVEQELAQAKAMLRDQIAEMTVQAVERVLQQKLDQPSDDKLISGILDELERQAPRQAG